MVCGRFVRRVLLKGDAQHCCFVAVLRVGCRLKGVQILMFCNRFARKVSLKVGAYHGWFVAVLHVVCRSKEMQTRQKTLRANQFVLRRVTGGSNSV